MVDNTTVEPVWAVVAGRMGSSRLPGKTMALLAGRPSLAHIVDRLRRVPQLAGVIVATTGEALDEPIRRLAEELEVPCHSGSADDVLDRTIAAARGVGAQTIVQVTGDCPLVEPELVAQAVELYRGERPDYVSTVLGGETFPVGLDVEVFSTDLLSEVESLTDDARDREHVSTYIYERPERFRCLGIEAVGPRRRPDLRVCIDTAEDLEVVGAVYDAMWPTNPTFGIDDVIDFLDRHPELARLNRTAA
jgi:spore coat polysaccharide biosynthesis protein SpsF